MNAIRFAAALALIGTSPLFASVDVVTNKGTPTALEFDYRIRPCDRLLVTEGATETFSRATARVVQRVSGILGLGDSTTRGFQTMGRNYNRSRNGF